MHNGDDTAYYLHKGFRVIAIEANPALAKRGEQRFAAALAAGRLKILNVGIAAAPGEAEFFDPTMHSAPLRRIAEETGGRFYAAADARGLAEDIRYAGRGVTSVEERELWNMPIILIALVGLVCAEWGYRRLVGLA